MLTQRRKARIFCAVLAVLLATAMRVVAQDPLDNLLPEKPGTYDGRLQTALEKDHKDAQESKKDNPVIMPFPEGFGTLEDRVDRLEIEVTACTIDSARKSEALYWIKKALEMFGVWADSLDKRTRRLEDIHECRAKGGDACKRLTED